jgi:hypothetical protein
MIFERSSSISFRVGGFASVFSFSSAPDPAIAPLHGDYELFFMAIIVLMKVLSPPHGLAFHSIILN